MKTNFLKKLFQKHIVDGPGMERTVFKIGDDVAPDKFKEFCYTYAETTEQGVFLRYHFYLENEKYMFCRESREGAFSEKEGAEGTKFARELTQDEWKAFWDFLCKGSLRAVTDDQNCGGAGPWLYLYLDGGFEAYREFFFESPGTILSFEEFCRKLCQGS